MNMRYSIIGIAWVCKTFSIGSNPVGAFGLNIIKLNQIKGKVAESGKATIC